MCSKEHRLSEGEPRDLAFHFTADRAELSLEDRGEYFLHKRKSKIILFDRPLQT